MHYKLSFLPATHLGPVVDGESDGVHGEGVATDEVTAKVDLGKPMQPCMQVCNLSNVVADAEKQASHKVFFPEVFPCKAGSLN